MSTKGYREKVHILKDIILTLSEYGELNQTQLISFCGLNLKKHRHILQVLEANKLVYTTEEKVGKRLVAKFKATQKGLEFCRTVLDPYEELFPRKIKSVNIKEAKVNSLSF